MQAPSMDVFARMMFVPASCAPKASDVWHSEDFREEFGMSAADVCARYYQNL